MKMIRTIRTGTKIPKDLFPITGSLRHPLTMASNQKTSIRKSWNIPLGSKIEEHQPTDRSPMNQTPMDLEEVKRLLEKKDASTNSAIDSMRKRFFEPLIMEGLKLEKVEPGVVICSMKVPARLLNAGGFLHGGATATLVDLVGSAAVYAAGAKTTGVSVEINVSYLDAAFEGEEVEIEARSLRVGKAVAVVSVEIRKKGSGRIVAQGRHTKYIAVASSKL